MAEGDVYIKTMAVVYMKAPFCMEPTKALAEARLAWKQRLEDERIIDELMKEDK